MSDENESTTNWTLQRCFIDQHGEAVDWKDVDEYDAGWHLSRYRIVSDDGQVVDFKDALEGA